MCPLPHDSATVALSVLAVQHDTDETAAQLHTLLACALLQLSPEQSHIAARRREAVRAVAGGWRCSLAVACWRHALAASPCTRFASAESLAAEMLQLATASAPASLAEVLASGRVAADGAMLFSSAHALVCSSCGRAFAGKRSLRNHAQQAHGLDYARSVAAVSVAVGVTLTTRACSGALHPCLAAARAGDDNALQQLHAGGWDATTCVDRHGSPALLWAAGAGHLSSCELLLALGASPTAAAKDGRSALHWAARNGHLAVVAWLLESSPLVADVQTLDGTTPLHLAAWRDHLDICRYLACTSGCDVRWRNSFGCDAGHWAAMGGATSVCAWLHSLGWDWNACNGAGHAALHKAAAHGHTATVSWLLCSAPQRIDAVDNEGHTPLALAALYGQTEGALLLLRHRAHSDGAAGLAREAGHASLAALLDANECVVAS